MSGYYDNFREIVDGLIEWIRYQISEFQRVDGSWIGGIWVQTDTDAIDRRKVVFGSKKLQDINFPECFIIPISDDLEWETFSSVKHNQKFDIIVIDENVDISEGVWRVTEIIYKIYDSFQDLLYSPNATWLDNYRINSVQVGSQDESSKIIHTAIMNLTIIRNEGL